MKSKLTNTQKAKIYCVKHGHANYITSCFGYVHCGRCGEQIGDRLGGSFPMDRTASIACNGSCKVCDPIYKKLSKLDKKVFNRLKKDLKDETCLPHEDILKGVDFGE